jgi:hypothetical protein
MRIQTTRPFDEDYSGLPESINPVVEMNMD